MKKWVRGIAKQLGIRGTNEAIAAKKYQNDKNRAAHFNKDKAELPRFQRISYKWQGATLPPPFVSEACMREVETSFAALASATHTIDHPVDSELRSLFALLDDPDPRIGEAVIERILKRGHGAIIPLTEFANLSNDALARHRAEEI